MSAARQLPLALPHEPSFAREDFLASPSNAAALALIDSWPRWPAPLMLLVGPPGAGKSHLAAIFAAATGAQAISGAELAGLDIDAAARPPALALDDADRGGGGEAAFFHLLNLTAARGVPILMTATAAPDLWGVATPDLLSRLRLAPVVELAPPEPALIEAVLIKLFADRQIDVDPSLAAYIARRLERSLAAARTLVDALDAEALARGGKVTRSLAAALLSQDRAGLASRATYPCGERVWRRAALPQIGRRTTNERSPCQHPQTKAFCSSAPRAASASPWRRNILKPAGTWSAPCAARRARRCTISRTRSAAGVEIETLDITEPDQIAALRARLAGRGFDMLFVNAGVTNESRRRRSARCRQRSSCA